MAKKISGYIKLQIPAGKATPAPPVGPALGQHGVNIQAFTKESFFRTIAGNTMYGAIRFIRRPGTIFNITIRWVVS